MPSTTATPAPPRTPSAGGPRAVSAGALGPALRTPMGVVLLVTIASRLLYWPRGIIGKDGELYINSMKLDETYNVPPPGNIGWVLLGKLFHALGLGPIDAFTLVSVVVSVVGTAYFFLLAARFLRPWTAAATTIALVLSPMVWYHAVVLMSYETWLCVPPVIAYYGVRYWDSRRPGHLLAAAAATGVGTILRPDMVAFAGPLLGGILLLGRAPARLWLASAAICAACCCVWFFGTAAAIGSIGRYLGYVRGQSEFIGTFGVASKGLFEGLARNGSKFAIFAAWGGAFVAPFALYGLWRLLRTMRADWRYAALGLLALLPSLYFGIWLFMGNAGLVLPTLGAAFLLAGLGLERALAGRRPAAPVVVMTAVGVLGAAHFMFAPLVEPPRDQRDVIYDVTFGQFTGRGVRSLYNYNLADYGVDSSLGNTLKQLRNPEPVPKMPEAARPKPRGAGEYLQPR